jgi:hypothetical protein
MPRVDFSEQRYDRNIISSLGAAKMISFLSQKYNLIMKYKEKIIMANFTELSAKDINEVNGGRILPYIITTGPIITPYLPVIVLGAAAAGAVSAALKK